MKKVIIVGKALGWQLAPSEGEIWGLNDLILNRDLSLLFDVHNSIPKKNIDKCNQRNVPIITLNSNELINENIIYPFKEIIKYFDTDLFTNTIDYMIAYAIYKNYEEIDIYGVSMGSVYEYKFQKPSLEFWCGYAMGRGIKVNIKGDEDGKLKLKGNIQYPIKSTKIEGFVKLGVFERATLLNIISQKHINNMKMLDEIRFTKKEKDVLKFKNEENKIEWLSDGDKQKKINLTVYEQIIISNYLTELNKVGLLNESHESLYRKFVI